MRDSEGLGTFPVAVIRAFICRDSYQFLPRPRDTATLQTKNTLHQDPDMNGSTHTCGESYQRHLVVPERSVPARSHLERDARTNSKPASSCDDMGVPRSGIK